jgi:hypothetical protein
MTFLDIACHVWAIDGYLDGDRARAVNAAYAAAAALTGTVQDNAADRTRALKLIIGNVQGHVNTRFFEPHIRITIYGGFRRGQNAPEHMWIECNNKIYETMPNHDLVQEAVTRNSRVSPQLELVPFQPKNVGSVEWYLTQYQQSYLHHKNWL